MKFTIRRKSKMRRSANKSASNSGGAKTSKSNAKHAAVSVRTYHAVTIGSRLKKCAACELIDGQAYLSSQAPALPLADCDNPGGCACKYLHRQDRREDMRRDTDHGLPDRRYDALDRRQGPDTRRSA